MVATYFFFQGFTNTQLIPIENYLRKLSYLGACPGFCEGGFGIEVECL